MKKISTRIKFCLIVMLGLCFGACHIAETKPVSLSMDEMSKRLFTTQTLTETNAYQIYVNQYKDEMAKVQYLVNLVRSSPLLFCRNNQNVDGEAAGRWLDYKIDLYQNEIVTVADFIDNVASYSRKTGREYIVIYDDNVQCAIKTIFYNELRRLEAYEQSQQDQRLQ